MRTWCCARSTFHFAGPTGRFTSPEELQGKRVATSYSNLVRNYLKEQRIDAEVVRLDGAIESSIRLGVADAIADVVETGNTMRAAGLETFGDPIMRSEALLIKRRGLEDGASLEVLGRRLRGSSRSTTRPPRSGSGSGSPRRGSNTRGR